MNTSTAGITRFLTIAEKEIADPETSAEDLFSIHDQAEDLMGVDGVHPALRTALSRVMVLAMRRVVKEVV